MNQSKISVRYAKAVFLTAREENALDSVLKDLNLLLAALPVEGFKNFTQSPVIATSSKKKVFAGVFKDSFHSISWSFVELILKNKRENYLEGIIRYYNRLYKEHMGIKEATLSVPVQASDKHIQEFNQLLEKLYNSKIQMNTEIDQDLIGGFILKVEDEQFDASVKTALARIKKIMTESSI